MNEYWAALFLLILCGLGLWKVYDLIDVLIVKLARWFKKKFLYAEIAPVLAESQPYEIFAESRYLLVVEPMSPDKAINLEEWLLSRGFNCIVFPSAKCKLFKLNDDGEENETHLY